MRHVFSLRQMLHADSFDTFVSLITQHFRALLQDKGDWNPSLYDLAWILCTDFFNPEEQQVQLEWLKSQQANDGLWGDKTYSPHSALVETLAVLMCLRTHNMDIPRLGGLSASLNHLIQACEEYPYHQTVAFELLAPALMRWLIDRGLELSLNIQSSQFLKQLGIKADKKLMMLQQSDQGLYSQNHTLGFSAELFALQTKHSHDIDQLSNLMMPNGSVGLSPAATAGLIILYKQSALPAPTELYNYLRSVYQDYKCVHFVNLHPAKQTRHLWNVLPWMLSGSLSYLLEEPSIKDVIKHLYETIHPDQVGCVAWDKHIATLPDLDDTAVSYALHCMLRGEGETLLNPYYHLHCFKHFQRQDGSLFCYPYELHPSPIAILHTLMASDIAEASLGQSFAQEPFNTQLRNDLLHTLNPVGKSFDELTHDKWHVTWTYGAQRWLSVTSIQVYYPDAVLEVIKETLFRQRGGWGELQPTLEETSYVILGLLSALKSHHLDLSQTIRHQIEKALLEAAHFMSDQLVQQQLAFPAIWISKNLYLPFDQVVSSIMCALYELKAWHYKSKEDI